MRGRALLTVLFLLLSLVFTSVTHAQTRVLVGPSGGMDFDNKSIGILFGLEVPFAKHYELDLSDTFSPLETHVALGGGYSNLFSGGGHVWFSQHYGLNGRVDSSSYDVTKISKAADYGVGGLSYRGIVGGFPARFNFDYIQEFNNGVTPSGLESPQLKGGEISYSMRFGCVKNFCVRTEEAYNAGRVKTQGSPICDGSLGHGLITCPRTSAYGGGFTASVLLEFPRRRSTEQDAF